MMISFILYQCPSLHLVLDGLLEDVGGDSVLAVLLGVELGVVVVTLLHCEGVSFLNGEAKLSVAETFTRSSGR